MFIWHKNTFIPQSTLNDFDQKMGTGSFGETTPTMMALHGFHGPWQTGAADPPWDSSWLMEQSFFHHKGRGLYHMGMRS